MFTRLWTPQARQTVWSVRLKRRMGSVNARHMSTSGLDERLFHGTHSHGHL